MPVLILEDNKNKIQGILEKLEYRGGTICITGYVGEAMFFLDTWPGPSDVYLDYELFPGAGNGMDFINEVVPARVGTIYLTSFNPGMRKEMFKRATERGMKVVDGWVPDGVPRRA
jgi:hypothetical protein